MSRLFKTIVLYVSMLVIPVQGFAASAMLHCGFVHQHPTAGQTADHHLARGDANRLAAHHQFRSEADVLQISVGRASSGEALNLTSSDHGLAKSGDSGAHEGSEHAACPVGAAVPASSLRFEPARQAAERIASTQLLNIGFVTDGPIRPPRSFPA